MTMLIIGKVNDDDDDNDNSNEIGTFNFINWSLYMMGFYFIGFIVINAFISRLQFTQQSGG